MFYVTSILIIFVFLYLINIDFIRYMFQKNPGLLIFNFILLSIALFLILRLESKRKKQIRELQKLSDKQLLSIETISTEAQVLRRLDAISGSFIENTNLEDVFGQILDSVKEILKVDITAIALVDENTKQSLVKIIRGRDTLVFDNSIKEKTLLNGNSILINNLSVDHTEYEQYKVLYSQGFKSFLIAPLRIGKGMIGFISALTVVPYDFTGENLRLLTTFSTQSALIIQNARLVETNMRLSITDEMTQLYNFRYFTQKIEEEFYRSHRYKRPLSLLMMDVDHFKEYNDAYGHLAGDVALRTIAHILKNSVRPTDYAFRYGGEEFTVVLIETGKDDSAEIAERIRKAVSETAFTDELGKPTKKITITIGIEIFRENIKLSSELVRSADNALYKGKKAGRNRVVFND